MNIMTTLTFSDEVHAVWGSVKRSHLVFSPYDCRITRCAIPTIAQKHVAPTAAATSSPHPTCPASPLGQRCGCSADSVCTRGEGATL